MGPTRLALLTLLVLPVGCAENAFLELTVNLPPLPTGCAETPRLFALIQARRADEFPFDNTEWRADEDPEALELGRETIPDHISLESKDETIDVNVRIRYCANERCTELGDGMAPEVWMVIERPFFIGKRTFFEFDTLNSAEYGDLNPPCPGVDPPLPPLTGQVKVINRCQVRGCVEGDMTTDYCRMDGTHLCEAPLN